ncbi:MAG TPA: hypothetical protein EYQ00_05350 [Dehalococcoidia bacterium]|nr:hypothetical protein [Dehalococcoidia bacterium]
MPEKVPTSQHMGETMKIFGKEWFSIGPDEAAIVLGKVRVDFHWPHPGSNPKRELVDTVAFLQHAISRPDWWEEWAQHEKELDAIARGPGLTLLEGGKKGEPQEPA